MGHRTTLGGETEYLAKWKGRKPAWQHWFDFTHRRNVLDNYEAIEETLDDVEAPPPMPAHRPRKRQPRQALNVAD